MRISSILKKVVMALTGLALFGFLFFHLAGNLCLLNGAHKFDAYSGFLSSLGLTLLLAEAGLLVFFILHTWSGTLVTLENRAARPEPYAVKKTAGESTLASRTMIWSGLIILVFVVWHVSSFKYGKRPPLAGGGPAEAEAEGSLWQLVITKFKNPWIAGGYVVALAILGLHLSHAFASALQTLGLDKPGWRERLALVGQWLGWAIALGFIVLPVWAYFLA